jgi:uncharacterized protein (DUF1810 family)
MGRFAPKEDPHGIYDRFIQSHALDFKTALREINEGEKQGCWIWFMLPTSPYVVNGEERGSEMNRLYALRGDNAVAAFLTFETVDGVNLRKNYIGLLKAIRRQQQMGNTLRWMFGSVDDSKAISSFQLFERVGRDMGDEELYNLCRQVLDLCAKERSSQHDIQ